MKNVTVIGAVVLAAGTAYASPVLGDYTTYSQISADRIEAIALDQSVAGASDTVYSNMDAGSGFQAFPAGDGVLGADDYTSTSASSVTLDNIRFVGGVVNAGETLVFEFFNDAGDTLVDAFQVSLADGGNFIWTINLAGTVTVDGSGILRVSAADDGSTGQWFLSDAAPTVGSEDNTFGGANGGALSHRFELNAVPAPGAIAMLGLGGLVAGRRRR